MSATRDLHDLGQSLWLDNITRDLLTSNTLARYAAELSVTGLTSNPTIFDHAIARSTAYDDEIRRLVQQGHSGEALLFELAIEDLTRAAELFAPVHDRTSGVDGWVSLEVSPILSHDTERTVAEAVALHRKAGRRNLFIKIPGTVEGAPAIEEAIFRSVPINVTLLFSREQYLTAAEAYLRGLERRLAKGKSLDVASVASVFLSRWDQAILERVPAGLRNTLGIAMGQQVYQVYRDLLDSDRWLRLANRGARPQRLLFASTGAKDPKASDLLYIGAMAAPLTINTMPEQTLLAFEDHGAVSGVLDRAGGDSERVLADFARAGIDVPKLAATLQEQGAQTFVKSWQDLLSSIEAKGQAIQ
jgi:transaldolase